MTNNYLVIMAGGIGSRFWPMSTVSTPKQFLDILGTGKTMIQQTVHRLRDIIPESNIFVVTSQAYKETVSTQLPSIPEENILLEPCMRNTAPCIAYASYRIFKDNPDANIVVAPSDHLITDESEFQRIILQSLNFTKESNTLLTLGIEPHRPETGYGYIQADSAIAPVRSVVAFKEKPDLKRAQEYLENGNYYWNSGIFIWSVKSVIYAFEQYLPEIADKFSSLMPIYGTEMEQTAVNNLYKDCESISIDYGIMESAKNIYVLPAQFGWSDLGTWGSLWEKREQDKDGNSIQGDNVNIFECENTIVTVPDDRTIVLQGLRDYIVVEANGVLMVCQKQEEQRIKEFREEVLKKVH